MIHDLGEVDEHKGQEGDQHHQPAHADHRTEAPKHALDVGNVIAAAVFFDRLRLQVVDAPNLAAETVVHHDREHIGHGDFKIVLAIRAVDVGDDRKGRRVFGMPQRFERRQFHGIEIVEPLSMEMSAAEHAEQSDHRVDRRQLHDGDE